MRLLEFSHDHTGINPAPAHLHNKNILDKQDLNEENAAPVRNVTPAQGQTSIEARQILRSHSETEQLQQRVRILEEQIYEQRHQASKHASVKDLKSLKKRLMLLERALHGEIVAASARENRIQKQLDRLDLKTRVINRLRKIWQHNLPAIGRWFVTAARSWWQEYQPEWWQGLSSAWHGALKQARH